MSESASLSEKSEFSISISLSLSLSSLFNQSSNSFLSLSVSSFKRNSHSQSRHLMMHLGMSHSPSVSLSLTLTCCVRERDRQSCTRCSAARLQQLRTQDQVRGIEGSHARVFHQQERESVCVCASEGASKSFNCYLYHVSLTLSLSSCCLMMRFIS